jgi:hypothetical protein
VRALEHESRIWPLSGMPLVVGPSPISQAWVDAAATSDFAPLEITLTDGRTWHRSPAIPRWDFTAGATLGRFSAAIVAGYETFGAAAQVDVMRGDGARLAITGTARAALYGGFDLSLVPAYSRIVATGRHGRLAAFVATRVRGGLTRYEVQGWDADHNGPYAIVTTRDVAVAPMAGVVALWRWAELRLTGGWEIFAVNRVFEWEERQTAVSRSGGGFLVLALRGRYGGPQ